MKGNNPIFSRSEMEDMLEQRRMHVERCGRFAAAFIDTRTKKIRDRIEEKRRDCMKDVRERYIRTGKFEVTPCVVLVDTGKLNDYDNGPHLGERCDTYEHAKPIMETLRSTVPDIKSIKLVNIPSTFYEDGTSRYEISIKLDK